MGLVQFLSCPSALSCKVFSFCKAGTLDITPAFSAGRVCLAHPLGEGLVSIQLAGCFRTAASNHTPQKRQASRLLLETASWSSSQHRSFTHTASEPGSQNPYAGRWGPKHTNILKIGFHLLFRKRSVKGTWNSNPLPLLEGAAQGSHRAPNGRWSPQTRLRWTAGLPHELQASGRRPPPGRRVLKPQRPKSEARGAAGGSEHGSRVSLPAGRRHARGPPGKGTLGPVLGTSSGKGRGAGRGGGTGSLSAPRRPTGSPARPSGWRAEPGHPERRGAAWRRPRPLGRPRLVGRKTPAPDPTPHHWTARGWDAGSWMLQKRPGDSFVRPLRVRFLKGPKLLPTRELLACPKSLQDCLKRPIFREDPWEPSVKIKTEGGVLTFSLTFLVLILKIGFPWQALAWKPTCTLKSCIHSLVSTTPSCLKYTSVNFFNECFSRY